jgi:hypothetical protein
VLLEGYHLETADGLASPLVWQSNSALVNVVGQSNTVWHAASNSQRFFRLVSP